MSNQMVEDLAAKAVSSIKKSGVREEILAALLHAVEVNAHEAFTEALLVAIGHAGIERDRAWVQQLQGEWSPKSGLKTATNPAEVEKEIRSWMAGRIAETRQMAFQQGYQDGFRVAVEQGIRLGWASREAEKSLEETLKAGAKIKPA